jgi:hypothetical protein
MTSTPGVVDQVAKSAIGRLVTLKPAPVEKATGRVFQSFVPVSAMSVGRPR